MTRLLLAAGVVAAALAGPAHAEKCYGPSVAGACTDSCGATCVVAAPYCNLAIPTACDPVNAVRVVVP